MATLFFLLSGEHENLPFSELRAILEAEGFDYEVLEKLDQVVRLEVDPACVEAIIRRAALTRICALELTNCEADMVHIVKTAGSARLDGLLAKEASFAVRVRRIRNSATSIDIMTIERTLGDLILSKVDDARVSLRKPDKTFFGILTGDRFVFGIKLGEISAKPFVERRPRKKPFFHPSAMQAKLARCMVNLSRPQIGDLVVDPFCGTGSMLIEASLIGCHVLGLDVQRRMARGALRNLVYFNLKPDGMIIADVRSLPITKIGCVVTDPPYGVSSTTLKRTTKQLVQELLISVNKMLKKGQRICMASPKSLKIRELGVALGFRHMESHFVYVHRSLTREIAVFEKV